MQHKNALRELTAMFFVGCLLATAISALAQNVVLNVQANAEIDPYPGLWAPVACAPSPLQQKTVYFTFDDGPSRNTEAILNVLEDNNVKATFFITAQCSDNTDVPAVLQRILHDGHEIGLHTYTHNYKKIYRSLEGYLNDLDALNRFVIDATGYRANILRFPGGSATGNCSKSLMKKIIAEIERRHYVYYDWDLVSGDETAQVKPARSLADNIVKNAKGNSVVILLHDSSGPKTTAQAVALAIPELRAKGYVFDKLTAQVEPVQLKRR